MPLSPLAVTRSAGRRFPVEPDPYRSDFRRDIGRVLYSQAFRRLAFKTQVFSPLEGDEFRSRLTHTLETAQIARVAAESLRLNAELSEAIALAHDLGHPPFGHQGEAVLHDLMAPYGGFDHNLQNIRVVTLREVKSPAHPGLNLTFETLAGIAKGAAAHAFLVSLYGEPPFKGERSLEADVADWADDLAYTATDFDDLVRHDALTLDQIRAFGLALVDRAMPKGVADPASALSVCVRNLVSLLVSDLIETSAHALAEGRRTVGLSGPMRSDYAQLTRFLSEHMYRNANLKAEALRGAAALRTLFERERAERRLGAHDAEGHLKLCDDLSSMTDLSVRKAVSGP